MFLDVSVSMNQLSAFSFQPSVEPHQIAAAMRNLKADG
jgi:hypothetical protein